MELWAEPVGSGGVPFTEIAASDMRPAQALVRTKKWEGSFLMMSPRLWDTPLPGPPLDLPFSFPNQ